MGGKVCSRCGVFKPCSEFYKRKEAKDGLRTDCKECVNARNKAYTERHVDRVREYKLEWWHANKTPGTLERKREFNHHYYINNQDKELARAREYRQDPRVTNRLKVYRRKSEVKARHNQLSSQRRQLPRYKQYRKRWRSENRDKERAYRLKRRASGNFSTDQWDELCRLCGGGCACCGKVGNLTVDHIIPVSRGGDNGIMNIQPLCLSCNSRKGTRTIDYRPEKVRDWARNQ